MDKTGAACQKTEKKNSSTNINFKKIQSDQRCYGFETTPPCRPCIISNAGYLLITRYLFSNNRLLHF